MLEPDLSDEHALLEAAYFDNDDLLTELALRPDPFVAAMGWPGAMREPALDDTGVALSGDLPEAPPTIGFRVPGIGPVAAIVLFGTAPLREIRVPTELPSGEPLGMVVVAAERIPRAWPSFVVGMLHHAAQQVHLFELKLEASDRGWRLTARTIAERSRPHGHLAGGSAEERG